MQPYSPEETQLLRQQIRTAIAAGRELDPEMDEHLADSVITHYLQERQRSVMSTPSANAPMHGRFMHRGHGMRSPLVPLVVLGGSIMLAHVLQFHVWFLLWLPFMLIVGAWLFSHRRRRTALAGRLPQSRRTQRQLMPYDDDMML